MISTRTKKVLDLVDQLVEAKSTVQKLETELNDLVGRSKRVSRTRASEKVTPPYSITTSMGLVLGLLQSTKRPLDRKAILEGTGITKSGTVSSALAKLKKGGYIKQPAPGQFISN